MPFLFKMPDLGEGIIEGEVVQWFVKEGDQVEADAPLLEVQNDKMLQEVPSPVSGKITRILVEAGSIANVGDTLVEFDGDKASVSEPAKEPQPEVTEKTSASEAFTFKMPDLGEGMVEGEVVQWFVKVGDQIEADAPLLEVQNDKMLQEVPSPVSGKITQILVEAGSIANVGDTLVIFDGGEAVGETTAVESVKLAPSTPEARVRNQVTYPDNTLAGRILAMPSVRQFAREQEVDLTKVQATGNHGHVTKSDVEGFLQGEVTPSAQVVQEAKTVATETVTTPEVKLSSSTPIVRGEATREKMTITRKAISNAMHNSKTKAAHVTVFDEVEVTPLMEHRARFKDIASQRDIKLTYLAYIAKAVVAVMKKFPVLNASIDEATDEIIYKHFYNVGIAVDTEAGLYVPNVKDADTKGIFTIAKEISELATQANAGTLKGPDMRNGTITISNIGSAWGQWFTPILNYPEVGIFGIGRIEKKPIVLDDGSLGVGNILHLSFSFDHRIVDGMTAQLAVNELKRLLSDPELLLMEV